MKFLLDTNVLSELIKPEPSQQVLDWISGISNEHLFISVITLGELSNGITKLPSGRKKNELISWFDRVQQSFQYQLFPISNKIAIKWGELTAVASCKGFVLPSIDGLIAATAYAHGAILITRNTKDFQSVPIQVLNPWL